MGKKIGEGAHSRIYLVNEKGNKHNQYAAKVSRTFDDEIHLQVKMLFLIFLTFFL